MRAAQQYEESCVRATAAATALYTALNDLGQLVNAALAAFPVPGGAQPGAPMEP